MSRLLVTGANGFVGRHLCPELISRGHEVRAALRRAHPDGPVSEQTQPVTAQLSGQVVVGDIDGSTDWGPALEGIDSVIHLAGRAHVMQEHSVDPLILYRQVNVAGSRRLAQQAAAAGVRRLIYLSSIKVNGERTGDQPFRETDAPAPEDAYGVSKWEAEQALRQVAEETGLELVIVRPVLIYGPGVKGNLLRLSRLIRRGIPLPFKSLDNRRSLLGIGNLLDFLHLCLSHPAAAGEVFLVCDGTDLSTPQLIREMAAAMGLTAKLWPFPTPWLISLARLFGRSAEVERLCGNLQVDIGKSARLLGWHPTVPAVEGLRAMLQAQGPD
ncbi:MAG: SDR family oxidoreductase [Candidatus Thiodiazotropha sp.]